MNASQVRLGGVWIRPLLAGDLAWAYDLETDPQIIQRFRLAGTTPSPQSYRQSFGRSSPSIQYLVVDESNGERIGFVYTFNTDVRNSRTSIALVSHPRHHGSGKFYRGVFLFIDYLFEAFPFERIYGQSLEFNFDQFAPDEQRRLDLASLFEVEVILREHAYMSGRWWDEYLVSVSQASWLAARNDIRALIEEDFEIERRGASIDGRHGGRAASGAVGTLFSGSSLMTPSARLRAVKERDVNWAADLFSKPQNRCALRIHGGPSTGGLSYEQVQRLLWQDVLCQFIIEDRVNSFPLGLVTAHRVDWTNLAVSFHVVIEPGLGKDLAVVEGIRRFVSYLFESFPVRKLYVEYPEGEQMLGVIEMALKERGPEILRREGCLRSWVSIGGRFHDVVVASVSRAAWDPQSEN